MSTETMYIGTADDELFVLEKITEEEQSESETDEINSTQLDSDNVNVEGVDQDFLYEPMKEPLRMKKFLKRTWLKI